MKKIFIIFLLLVSIGILYSSRRHTFSIPHLDDEINEIYYNLDQLKTSNIYLVPTGKFYLDGGFDTYIYEIEANAIAMQIGGADKFRFTGSYFAGIGDGGLDLGIGTANDFDIVYYHTLSQHSGKKDKKNIKKVSTDTFKADWLPDPQTYERKTSTGIIEYGLIAEDCPEEVIFREDGEIAGIKTTALIAYLIGVVKEMDKELKKKKDK